MPLEDQIGAVDPQAVVSDLLAQREPDLAQNGRVDPQAVVSRLLRAHVRGGVQGALQETQPGPKTFNPGDYGTDPNAPKMSPDVIASYGTPEKPEGQEAKPVSSEFGGPPEESIVGKIANAAGQVAGAEETLRHSIGAAPIAAVGKAVSGAPVMFNPTGQAPTEGDLINAIAGTPQGEVAIGGSMKPPASVQETPTYKAGEAIQKFAQTAGPTEKQQQEHPFMATAGRTVGDVGTYLVLGAINPMLGIAGGAAMMGLSSAADTYAEAKKHGASEATATQAAQQMGEISAALGSLPIGAVFAPIKAYMPEAAGLAARVLADAAKDGLVFAGVGEAQEYLGQKIAAMYDPNAGYSPKLERLLTNLGIGAIVGGGHAALGDLGAAKAPQQQAQAPGTQAGGAAAQGGVAPQAPPGTGGAGAAPSATPQQPFASKYRPEVRANLEGAAVKAGLDPDQVRGMSDDDLTGFVRKKNAETSAQARAENQKPQTQREKVEARARQFTDLSDEEIKGMSTEDLVRRTNEAENEPTSETDFGRTKEQASDEDVLRKHGYTDDEINGLKPEERDAAVEEAIKAGASAEGAGRRDEPVELRTARDVARAAGMANQDHSHAQGEANNVQRGHGTWFGLNVTFEAPAGGKRRGVGPDGNPFETVHPHAYGYFTGLPTAPDGQHPDVTIGDHPSAPTVYVIDEVDKHTGKFRQPKTFVGFQTPADAHRSYTGISSKSTEAVGGMRAFSRDEFPELARQGLLTRPVSDAHYNNVSGGGAPAQPAPSTQDHADVEAAIRKGGMDPAEVRPADIHRAAEIMAAEGLPPEDAFPIAVVRSLIEDGHIPVETAQKVLGHEATQAILDARQGGGHGEPPAQAPSAGTGGQTPALPAGVAGGGHENEGAKAAEAGRAGAQTAEAAGKSTDAGAVREADTGQRAAEAPAPEPRGGAKAVASAEHEPAQPAEGPRRKPVEAPPPEITPSAETPQPHAAAEPRPEQPKRPEQRPVKGTSQAGPETLSLEDFKAAVRRGVIGPADQGNSDFSRVDRAPIEPRGNPRTLIWHRDVGMNYGYGIDDIARHQAHSWGLDNDKRYEASYRHWHGQRDAGKRVGPPPEIPEKVIEGAYQKLQQETGKYGAPKTATEATKADIARTKAQGANAVEDAIFEPETGEQPKRPEQRPVGGKPFAGMIENQEAYKQAAKKRREQQGGGTHEIYKTKAAEEAARRGRTVQEANEERAKLVDANRKKLAAVLKSRRVPREAFSDEVWSGAIDRMIDQGLEPLDALDAAHDKAEREAIIAESEASEAAAEKEEAARESHPKAVGQSPPVARPVQENKESAPAQVGAGGEHARTAEPHPERGGREPTGGAKRQPVTERGAEGKPQLVLPGAERISSAALAKRRANERLKPKVAQKPADQGLFSDESKQLDLVEQARKSESPSKRLLAKIVGGERTVLANGWELKPSTVAGEQRIELAGPTTDEGDRLTPYGVFSERINRKTRYFIPTEPDRGAKTLAAVLKEHPIAEEAKPKFDRLAEEEGRLSAPPFYSAIERTVENAKQQKASPEQWLGMLKNAPGVKPEEMEWLGLEPWLREQKGTVSKQQVTDYIRANAIEVKETMQKPYPDMGPRLREIGDRLEQIQNEFDRLHEQRDSADVALRRQELANEKIALHAEITRIHTTERPPHAEPRYGQYTLPGGENYRELLLMLPPKIEGGVGLTMDDVAARLGYGGWSSRLTPDQIAHIERVFESQKMGPSEFNSRLRGIDDKIEQLRRQMPGNRDDADLRRVRNEIQALDNERGVLMAQKEATRTAQYKSSHWDEPNVLAHIRFDDRVTDGKKTLHIAEVQSDWHQAGRKRGYAQPPLNDSEKAELRTFLQRQDQAQNRQQFLDSLSSDERGRLRELETKRDAAGLSVPNAPFKTTWPELSLKRMIRYAAEHGYERVSWDTGETNAERYDLSKHIDRIEYEPIHDPANTFEVVAYDKNNRQVFHEDEIPATRVEEVLGKEIADKIQSGHGDQKGEPGSGYRNWKTLSGLDLKVGGEGMRGFYDKILPAAANKLVKKFGAKIERSEVVNPHEAAAYEELNRGQRAPVGDRSLAYVSVHSLDITPELREAAVRQGFALFQPPERLTEEDRARELAWLRGEFYPERGRPLGQQAQHHVLQRGRETDREHLVAFDQAGKTIATTSGERNGVTIPQEASAAFRDAHNQIVLHHNHPNNSVLSLQDLSMLALPGVKSIWSHGHEGNISRVELTPIGRELFTTIGDPDTGVAGLQRLLFSIAKTLTPALKRMADAGAIAEKRASFLRSYLVAEAFHRAGLMDRHTSENFEHEIDRLNLEPIISHVTRTLIRSIPNAYNQAGTVDGSVRRAGLLLDHPGEMGTVFRPITETAGQRREQAGADRERAGADRQDQARRLEAAPPTLGALGDWHKTAQTFKDFWVSTFQPELFSDRALEADPLFARYKARSAQEKDSLIKSSEEEWNYWNKKSDAERIRFLMNWERGIAPNIPEELATYRRWRRILDENWQAEQNAGSTGGMINEYFPHIWKNPEQFRRIFGEGGSTEQVGPTWFQKGRTFKYIEDGLAAGLELKYTNPIDILVHRLSSGVDMRQRMGLLRALQGMGLADHRGTDPLIKRGWAPINAPDRQRWVLAPDVQALWQNGVNAKGLWQAEGPGGSLFRGWMSLKNAWVPIRLSLSMFHPVHVLGIDAANSFALAWEELAKGHSIERALTAAARLPGVSGLRQGTKAKHAWEKMRRDQTPEEKAIVDLMTDGGFVPQLSEQQRIKGQRAMQEAIAAIQRGEHSAPAWLKALYGAARIPMEKMQGPIFERWIPALKAAAYLNQAVAVIHRNPQYLHDDAKRRIALRTIAKSIDNRYGEMFYGNLFWNRTLKDAGIGSFLSLGWNLGGWREYAAAPVQFGVQSIRRLLGKETPNQRAKREAGNKMAALWAYGLLGAAVLGALNYFMTGEMPHGLDYIFPRTGGLNPDGTPRRITSPFYHREIPMWMKHGQEQGGNYLKGTADFVYSKMMFEPFVELLNNRNYFGFELWDTNAPFYQKFWQGLRSWFGSQMSPMSMSGASHAANLSGKPFPSASEALSNPGKITDALMAHGVFASMLGFSPAPSYVEKSALQNRIFYLYGLRNGGTKPEELGENYERLMAVKEALKIAKRDHDAAAMTENRKKAIELGMKPTAISKMLNSRDTVDAYLFSRLPETDQLSLMREANVEERHHYWMKMHDKARIKLQAEHLEH
jgi:hypothetical protein